MALLLLFVDSVQREKEGHRVTAVKHIHIHTAVLHHTERRARGDGFHHKNKIAENAEEWNSPEQVRSVCTTVRWSAKHVASSGNVNTVCMYMYVCGPL